MRIALISDIHGNLAGFKTVLTDLADKGCERIICLGDLVEGGGQDAQVVRLLVELGVECIKGNHDEHNDLALEPDVRDYLAALPSKLVVDDALFVHITPRCGARQRSRAIDSACEAWNVFDETDFRLVFVGHTHRSLIYGERSPEAVEAAQYTVEWGVPFDLEPEDRFVISVGAVGYPRDHHQSLRYGIWDRNQSTVTIHALDGPLVVRSRPELDGATTQGAEARHGQA